MDTDFKAIDVEMLKLWAEQLECNDNYSIEEARLRAFLTKEEFSRYKLEKAELIKAVVHPPSLPPAAQAYWDKCKSIIAASKRARTDNARRAASSASEKCQEAFEDLSDDEKSYFCELNFSEWRDEFGNAVEYHFPVPKQRKPIRLYSGTAKNASQRLAIQGALASRQAAVDNTSNNDVVAAKPTGLKKMQAD